MGTHLLGSHDLVRLEHLRIWADNGFIKMEDSRDNSYKVLSVMDALERVDAINGMIGKSSDEVDLMDIREKLQRFVARMIPVIKKAQLQGSPDDPSAVKARNRERKKVFLMPGMTKSLPL